MKKTEQHLRIAYMVSDFVATSIAVVLFNVSRYILLPAANKAFGSAMEFLQQPVVMAGQVLFPLGMLYVYYLSGFYHSVVRKSRVQEFTTTLITALVGTLVVIFVALINDLTNDRAQDYRVFFIVFFLLFTLVYIPRLLITTHTLKRVESRQLYYRTAVVNGSTDNDALNEVLKQLTPLTLMKVVAVANIGGRIAAGASDNVEMIDEKELALRASQGELERLVIVHSDKGWEHTLEILNRLFPLGLPMFVSAQSQPAFLFNTKLSTLTTAPLIDVSQSSISPSTLCLKRSFDVVVSVLALVVLALPLMIAAAAVAVDSRGPVVYRQRRVGRYGREFNILKLRTMKVNAERMGQPELSRERDPRVTRVGAVLRKYRIDECLQFVNVLRGDMSIVGPRPERRYYVEKILEQEPSYVLIQRVRPGITSLAMVRFGYASDVSQMIERMRYDLLYLENMSMLTDLKIIANTVSTVVGGKGV